MQRLEDPRVTRPTVRPPLFERFASWTSNSFETGHRIRIEVSSSDFPNFGRSLDTAYSDTGTEVRVAHTKIPHTNQYPSAIVLPVVPPSATQSASW